MSSKKASSSETMAPAVGRPTGKLFVGANGLSGYQYKIEVPPGIGEGNNPELSLVYSQGAPNGTLGKGWNLAGLSSIQLKPAALAFDSPNNTDDYDRSKPRYSLDGRELLNIHGEYGAADALYKTEIDNEGTTVAVLGDGFSSQDSSGRKCEYGTTADSRLQSSDGKTTREWRLSKRIDPFGNSIAYQYLATPTGSASDSDGKIRDQNTSYIERIIYTSNEAAGYRGRRLVLFDYISRDDPVVNSWFGVKVVCAHRLAKIRVAVQTESGVVDLRAYKLDYSVSPVTACSQLSTITEISSDGVALTPTEFKYTGSTPDPTQLFQLDASDIYIPPHTSNNVALMPMNISGLAFTDLACIRYDMSTFNLSVKTFQASKVEGTNSTYPKIEWSPSDGDGAEAWLPPVEINQDHPPPRMLGADLNGDGRADLIIPFRGSDGNLQFSISESNGTGFSDYFVKKTAFTWEDQAAFMTTNLSGGGHTDVVQIFPDQQKLAFRVFSSIDEAGHLSLTDAKISRTSYNFVDTISWLDVGASMDGSKTLVRIWASDDGGNHILKATSFKLQQNLTSDQQLEETATSVIGTYDTEERSKITVLTCDVNGDGVQDLVTCFLDPVGEGCETTINITFTTFLNDGLGNFERNGDPSPLRFTMPADQAPDGIGDFHITNLYAADYPCISYVYQEYISGNYCALVTQSSCTGLFGPLRYYTLAEKQALPAGSFEIMSADFNGTGLGDWLFHQLKDDVYTACPVYNTGTPTDILFSARDSMGLLSTVSYMPMSNSDIYRSGVDWKNYPQQEHKDAYTLIAASSYVVSKVEQTNDPTVNGLPFKSVQEKVYGGAKINMRGQGWQGFSQIWSYDPVVDVTVLEFYIQDWPGTGLKSEEVIIKGRDPNGAQVKSTKQIYEYPATQRGKWKISRIDKTREQVDFLEDGKVVRSSATNYVYDEAGNVVLESVAGPEQKLWTRYSYTNIKGVPSLMTGKKVSSRESNTNLKSFEDGDLELTLATYDLDSVCPTSVSSWSTDMAQFATKILQYDKYGNKIYTKDAAGLETSTRYDDEFHAYVLSITESGSGVKLVRGFAFNALYGTQVAQQDAQGAIILSAYDSFGRCSSSRKNYDGAIGKTALVPASSFLGESAILQDEQFKSILSGAKFAPYQETKLLQAKSPAGATYILSTEVTLTGEGPDHRSIRQELLDCNGRVRKRGLYHGLSDGVWHYSDYDSRGCKTLQSYPVKISKAGQVSTLDWIPNPQDCMRISFDELQRPTKIERPSHGDVNTVISQERYYREGGSNVQTRISKFSRSSPADAVLLSDTNHQYATINGSQLLIASKNEVGEVTTFEYDGLGRMIKGTDAQGNIELRSFNGTGSIVRIENSYSGVSTNKYDLSNRIIEEQNSMNEVTTHQYDAKGRLISSTAHCGRTVRYIYEDSGYDLLSSVTVSLSGDSSVFESRHQFKYNACGKPVTSTISLSQDDSFTTSFAYDWLQQEVAKTLPDGSLVSHRYNGGLVSKVGVEGTNWQLNATYEQYSSFEKPEKWSVQGLGDVAAQFSHTAAFDSQGFPTNHAFRNGKSLVDNHYVFDELDQLSLVHEFNTGDTVNYTYSAGRLISSQTGSSSPSIYKYDPSGNLTKNGDLTCSYAAKLVTAQAEDGSKIEVAYDTAGRMIKREAKESSFSFEYDGFGKISSVQDLHTQKSSEILSDYRGRTLVRKLPDGTQEIQLSRDYEVLRRPDGSQRIQRRLFGPDELLATAVTEVAATRSATPASKKHSANFFYADTKGSITHIFKVDGTRTQRKVYSAFGDTESGSETDNSNTYEAVHRDEPTGLLDFGARWYDPVLGRFTTTDNILDEASMKRVDGLNRFAFENNNPVNHVDPTGHWSLPAILGAVLGAILFVAGVALTIATMGATLPLLVAMVVGG
jgi:RHS repeat-associated protein